MCYNEQKNEYLLNRNNKKVKTENKKEGLLSDPLSEMIDELFINSIKGFKSISDVIIANLFVPLHTIRNSVKAPYEDIVRLYLSGTPQSANGVTYNTVSKYMYFKNASGFEYSGGYSGEYKQGNGDCKFANGDIYNGPWNYNNRDGIGKYIWASNQQLFYGEFVNNELGFGYLTTKKGYICLKDYLKVIPILSFYRYENSCIGMNIKIDDHNGKKIEFYSSGFYIGMNTDLTINGKGIYVFDDGGIFKGNFVNVKQNGFGKNFYANKDVYIGYFKDGKKHGQGTLYKHDGTVLKGLFENGEYVGE